MEKFKPDQKIPVIDVLIVGAGISGINAAYRLQEQSPNSTYVILESREELGGTWSFFNYPGIRSDSDLFTFGFNWRPWTEDDFIAEGPKILDYVRESARLYGLDQKILYNHKVESANWSYERQFWEIDVRTKEGTRRFNARWLLACSGFYDYQTPLQTTIPGIKDFKGEVLHPQFWQKDFQEDGKKIAIIGSGATAVSLVPALAGKAANVTMIQRTPGYILPLPSLSRFFQTLSAVFPAQLAHWLMRIFFLIASAGMSVYCALFPNNARKFFRSKVEPLLPPEVPFDPHFVPPYNPWEQRLCVCPNADFFQPLLSGKATIKTGHIKTVTASGITMQSGEEIDADVIVTATGLTLRFGGGIRMTLGGKPLVFSDKYLWRGCMLSDVPNFALFFGYLQAFSFTLGADATIRSLIRVEKHLQRNGFTAAVPHISPQDDVQDRRMMTLRSNYILREEKNLPKAGDRAPWKTRHSYFHDIFFAKYGDVTKGLQFVKAR